MRAWATTVQGRTGGPSGVHKEPGSWGGGCSLAGHSHEQQLGWGSSCSLPVWGNPGPYLDRELRASVLEAGGVTPAILDLPIEGDPQEG